MINSRKSFLRGMALPAALAATMVFSGVASANPYIDWILQPSGTISISGQLGSMAFDQDGQPIPTAFDNNGNPTAYQLSELYNGVAQTGNGTLLYPNGGFTSSLTTYDIGTVTSYADANGNNNFLQSINFGAQPPDPVKPGDPPNPDAVSLANAHVITLNSGQWLPNPTFGVGSPGSYGTPTGANVAEGLKLADGYTLPTGGDNLNNGNGGFVALSNAWQTISSRGTAMPVDSTGHFNAAPLAVTGSFHLSVNYNGNYNQVVLPLPDITGTLDNGDLTKAPPIDAFITRGTGTNSYQYLVHVPLPSEALSGYVPAQFLYYNVNLSFNLVAAANLQQGDSNFDGVVNGLDISQVASNWLHSDPNHLGLGDVNGDGVVNGLDIALIASHWLQTTPTLPTNVTPGNMNADMYNPGLSGSSVSAVPEPGTWTLLGLGTVGLWVMRRRVAR